VAAAVLRCYECGETTADLTATGCRTCGGPLVVQADRAYDRQQFGGRAQGEGLWRFADVMIPIAPEHRVTLAEGDTPLLDTPALAREVGVGRLLVKDDARCPTGTFKDRCVAVAASVAAQIDSPGLVCASTGNAGASTAAYAAAAGVPAVILIPAATPPSKMAQAITYGAQLVAVEGNYSDAWKLARTAAETLGYVNTTTTYVSPYSAEGSRSVAYELHEQLPEPPDWIVVPCGAGALLAGINDAYQEMKAAGLIDRTPRMLAVQPSGCAPIVRAWEEDAEKVSAWPEEPSTRVGSLADPLTGYEREGNLTLDAVRASEGAGVGVPDDETMDAVRALGSRAGVFAEPGGAIGVAAVKRAVAAGIIAPDATVVCCITGNGLKDPFASVPDVKPPVLPAERDALMAWLSEAHGTQGE
jgi:threonine synthase